MPNKHKRILIGMILAGLAAGAGPLWGQKNSCLECHKQLEDSLLAPAQGMAQDVHQKFGLSCVSCHGGNPNQDDVDLAKDKTYEYAFAVK